MNKVIVFLDVDKSEVIKNIEIFFPIFNTFLLETETIRSDQFRVIQSLMKSEEFYIFFPDSFPDISRLEINDSQILSYLRENTQRSVQGFFVSNEQLSLMNRYPEFSSFSKIVEIYSTKSIKPEESIKNGATHFLLRASSVKGDKYVSTQQKIKMISNYLNNLLKINQPEVI